jgi:hypothetical protein
LPFLLVCQTRGLMLAKHSESDCVLRYDQLFEY